MVEWLTLQEYSNQYKVSISTLRRRIKNQEIEYMFENSKYLLQNKPESSKPSKNLSHYKALLEAQQAEITNLIHQLEDLKHFVSLVEKENSELKELLEKSPEFEPKPQL